MNSVTEKKGTFPQNGFLPVTPDGLSDVDREEKQRLIKQVLELQHTLVDLSKRVDAVKEENVNLRSENQILGQYIEKLMATSSIFQSSSPPPPPTSGSHMGHSVSSSTGAADGSTDSFHYEECSELASEDDIA